MRYAKKPLSKTAVVFVFSQFPMGKVKAKSTTTTGSNVPVYQFPIGKVKVGRRLKRCARSLYVSIPYGKGKVSRSIALHIFFFCINSLWER